MIKEAFYKDRPAVVVSDGEYEATFLPLDGAKLVSLKDNRGFEYMAVAEGEKYRRLGLDSSYVDAECSAFDDMFPTIDPCEINGIVYLDHGEVARREHKYEVRGETLEFSLELEGLNAVFKKSVCFKDGALSLKYTIKNLNSFDFPYIYAGHMMFRGEAGARVVCRRTEEAQTELMFGSPEGSPEVLCEGGKKQWKYYYSKAVSPLDCAIEYPSGYSISVKSDSDILKYLGAWLNPCDLNGMCNVALEPCTALYDDPIRAKYTCSYIKPQQEIEFEMNISIKKRP